MIFGLDVLDDRSGRFSCTTFFMVLFMFEEADRTPDDSGLTYTDVQEFAQPD